MKPQLLLEPLKCPAKEGAPALGGVMDPDCQGEIELLVYSGGQKKYSEIQEVSSLPYSVIKISGKLQPNLAGTITVQTPQK